MISVNMEQVSNPLHTFVEKYKAKKKRKKQRGLLRRIKHVDELSLSISQSMVFSLNQKKLVSEKLSEGLKENTKCALIHCVNSCNYQRTCKYNTTTNSTSL